MIRLFLLASASIIVFEIEAQILTSEVKVEQTGNITSIQGQVGIGTAAPFQKLSIQDGQLYFGHSATNQFESGRLRFSEYASGHYQGAFIHYDGSNNVFNIGVHEPGGTNLADDKNAISIRRSNGNVGVGLAPTNFKLEVNGSIKGTTLHTATQNWSDFVFYDEYELRTLEEVEKHIAEKGHLPEIPSEAEVTKNGINLGEMDAKLLQKIEELTLYMIDMNKRMKQIETENTELKEKVKSLENE